MRVAYKYWVDFCFMSITSPTPVLRRAAPVSVALSVMIGFSLLVLGAKVHASIGNFTMPNTSSALSKTVPSCTPTNFGAPPQLDLTDMATGLTVVSDSPLQYRINGSTAGELRTQIQHCGPHSDSTSEAEFTAQTSYDLSWQYVVENNGTSCSLTDVKVGIHTAIDMPVWQPTNSATSGLSGRWQLFEANLLSHESGHVKIDVQYAGRLVNSLRDLSDIPCGDITNTVSSDTRKVTDALSKANDTYDTSTNHGATQGAVLPMY